MLHLTINLRAAPAVGGRLVTETIMVPGGYQPVIRQVLVSLGALVCFDSPVRFAERSEPATT